MNLKAHPDWSLVTIYKFKFSDEDLRSFHKGVHPGVFLWKYYRSQTIVALIIKSSSKGGPWRWVLVVHQALYIRDQNSENNPFTVQELNQSWIIWHFHVNIDAAPNMRRVGPEVQIQLKIVNNHNNINNNSNDNDNDNNNYMYLLVPAILNARSFLCQKIVKIDYNKSTIILMKGTN